MKSGSTAIHYGPFHVIRRENTSRGHIQLQMYPRTHATGKARTSTRTDNCSDRSIGCTWSGPKRELRSLGSGGCALSIILNAFRQIYYRIYRDEIISRRSRSSFSPQCNRKNQVDGKRYRLDKSIREIAIHSISTVIRDVCIVVNDACVVYIECRRWHRPFDQCLKDDTRSRTWTA